MQPLDETSIPHTVTSVEGQRAVWIAGPTCVRHEVVGEVHHPEQMHRVLSWVQGRTDAIVTGWLVPEPQSGFDRLAVAVWVLGGKVGYLPRELAPWWQPLLGRLAARHGAPVACRASLDPPSVANQGVHGIVVWLPVLSAPPAIPSQGTVAVPQPSAPQASPEQLEELLADIKAARKELASVEEALEIQSFGFYKPRYGFESSAQYVSRLASIREHQKGMIGDETAAPRETEGTVEESAAERREMARQQATLMLRAFNGECDAAIAKVSYDNAVTLEARVAKAFEAINKLGEVQRVFIARRYLDLKLAELHLVHEHREKVQQEREEQKRIQEQMREEQKAKAEIDRAQAVAERQEAVAREALAKARAALATSVASETQHESREALVSRLEDELTGALDRKAKAIARAQLTQSGHVYVLSNVGSFGEGVYTIGMTQRLDPMERVDELGGDSVPFPFDVHAIIYAADAPGLENKLHRVFEERRVNLVNARKGYFRVTLDEIRVEVEKLHGLVTFVLAPPAEEYRKTLAAASVSAGDEGEG